MDQDLLKYCSLLYRCCWHWLTSLPLRGERLGMKPFSEIGMSLKNRSSTSSNKVKRLKSFWG